MAAILDDHKLFYASVPKVACSSVKRMFYEIENGVAFDKIVANGKRYYVHHFYPGILRNTYPEARIADYRRLCLVRDPIKRFLSAYGNRVVFHRELTPRTVKAAGRFKRLTPPSRTR